MYDLEKVEKFRSETLEKYSEKTIIDEVISRELYDPSKHNGDFFQTGIRTNLPMKFFTGGYGTFALSNDYARAIFISERNHILSGIDDRVELGEASIKKLEAFSPNQLVRAINTVSNPTDIFVPTAFSDDLHSWIGNDMLDFNVSATYIEVGSQRVRIRWVPNKHGFEDIYAINSNELRIIQKREEHAKDVEFLDEIEECKFNSSEDLLMTYFGKIQKEPNEFDFFIRTVLSNPITTERSACVIDTDTLDYDFENENEQ